ncbi:protein TolA [Bradyrhizobium sp.]|uniref:protein TolA n=1 Tax=Bradyrhizobium sp. TaxID=376 RepID=UPI0026269096|nr:protein TolA [Bradyrhizobium sp.]
MKVKVDKTVVASIVLHVLVLGWGLFTFSTKAFVMPEEDTVPVDVISADQLAKVTAGMRSGKKENPKPLVEKVAEAKPPQDDIMGKIDKTPVVTETAPPPQPKPVEKPVEKKPDPPKPVAKSEPKPEPKQVEKKPDMTDPIAEALKKEEKKPPPKPQAATPPKPQKPKERVFDEAKIAALLDKRDPAHQAVTGDTLNSNAALGTSKGKAEAIVATWRGAFAAAVRRCFNFPYNGLNADKFEADIDIYLRPDGTLASQPTIVAVRGPSESIGKAMAENAARAVVQCQAYSFLPKEQYETWKYIGMTFSLKDML